MDLAVLAFLVAFVAFAAIVLVFDRRYDQDEYDERQMLERGRAYNRGFSLILGANFFLALAVLFWPGLQRYALAMLMGSACLGGIVVVVRCIWTDAYFSTSRSIKGYLPITALAAVVNLANVFVRASLSSFEEFVTSEGTLYLATGLIFVAALATYLAKIATTKHGDA